MVYIALPDEETRRLSFYLAMEEYVARRLNTDDDCFFMWQVRPTVIFGRNQLIEAEVNLEFCRRNGIETYRRKSGGGCVYADMSNIMFSYITRDEEVNFTFNRYINMVVLMLCKLGVEASSSGRNDILIRGARNEEGGARSEEQEASEWRKVSGNAFYHIPGHSIVHGTMLYDTNPELMEGALHPDVSKLERKGVKSVRSRVGLLKDYLPFGVGELRQQLRHLLCDRSITLADDDIQEIERLEQRYYEPEYLLGSTGRADIVRKRRIEGCGMVELHFLLEGSLIRDVELRGDFFELGDAASAFRKAMTGIPFTPESLREAIRTYHPEHTVRGLSEAEIASLLTE